MKYCVVRVNLTQKFYEIVCTGLYQSEAEFIADRRNLARANHKEPVYKFHHDEIKYVSCRNSHVIIEYTLASLYPEYFHTK